MVNTNSQAFANTFNGVKGTLKCKPGWSDCVEDLHKYACDFVIMWCAVGKHKQGQIFQCMLTTKARFKYTMTLIKHHEYRLHSEPLAKKMSRAIKV